MRFGTGLICGLAFCLAAAAAAPKYERAQLHRYSVAQLQAFLTQASLDRNRRADAAFADAVKDELAARRDTKAMIAVFRSSRDEAQLRGVGEVLIRLRGAGVDAAIRPYFIAAADVRAMLAAEYFGEKCDARALDILKRNFDRYPLGVDDMAAIAGIFGKCRYQPAGPILAEWVDAGNMEMGGIAAQTLAEIFPDAHVRDDGTPEECAAAWRRYFAARKTGKP